MSSRIALILCLLLAILFCVLSYRAICTKSPTYDEPVHFGAAYAHTYLNDDRIDPENPVLWKRWPMLAIARGAMRFDPADPAWREAGQVFPTKNWSVHALFEGHPEHGVALINRARFAMVMLGAMTCLAAAWWAHQIAGPWAAVAAAAIIALDPTFLAHGPLIKNDVPMTLAMLLALMAVWRAGQRLTIFNALALAILCAIAVNTKLSAVLLPAIVVVCLMIRAAMPASWIVFRRPLVSRPRRFLVAAAMALFIVATIFVITWAAYGFRFAPSSDPSLAFQPEEPFVGGVDRLVIFAQDHRLLPQSFSIGLLRQHFLTQHTRNFLLGSISIHGWWYYFPFAFVVKTPLATLIAVLIAPAAVVALQRLRSAKLGGWTTLCLLGPVALFLAAAMTSDYEHGLRNVLPIIPPIYIAAGVVFARVMKVWRRNCCVLGAVLLIALGVESFGAYPNYLSFFNVAAGGSRGGLALLGDSNLDWGQDLSLLLAWHRKHPDKKIYLAYWGGVDPMTFGLNYTPLPGYWNGIPDAPPNPDEPGVLAISATLLQGIYIRDQWVPMYMEISTWEPREVLGGSIYIYDYPSSHMAQRR